MPIYEYRCKKCGLITESYFHTYDFLPEVECSHDGCGGVATRILSSCFVHGDTPSYINDDLRNALQKDDEKPIETRGQLKAYCDSHDIIPTG